MSKVKTITRTIGDVSKDMHALIAVSKVPFQAYVSFRLGKMFSSLNVEMERYQDEVKKATKNVQAAIDVFDGDNKTKLTELYHSNFPTFQETLDAVSEEANRIILNDSNSEGVDSVPAPPSPIEAAAAIIEQEMLEIVKLDAEEISFPIPGLKISHFKKSNGKITKDTEFHPLASIFFINLEWLIEDDIDEDMAELLMASNA